MSSDKTPLPADVRTDTRDLPQRERVLALQLTGGVPHHEGAVGSVSQFLVHFLSANTRMRTGMVGEEPTDVEVPLHVVIVSFMIKASPGDFSPVPLGLCQQAAGVRHR